MDSLQEIIIETSGHRNQYFYNKMMKFRFSQIYKAW